MVSLLLFLSNFCPDVKRWSQTRNPASIFLAIFPNTFFSLLVLKMTISKTAFKVRLKNCWYCFRCHIEHPPSRVLWYSMKLQLFPGNSPHTNSCFLTDMFNRWRTALFALVYLNFLGRVNSQHLDAYYNYLSPQDPFVPSNLLQPSTPVPSENIPPGASSMGFVFDITGSMYDDLVQVIDGAAKILATTLARQEQPLYNYVLVPFHDPGW